MQAGLCFMLQGSVKDIAEVKITADPLHNKKQIAILKRFVSMWEGCEIEAYKARQGHDTIRQMASMGIPKGKRKARLCVEGIDMWDWLLAV